MALKRRKNVAESWKFIKYLIKTCVRLYFITLINREKGIGYALP
jgi:hypothetical protein